MVHSAMAICGTSVLGYLWHDSFLALCGTIFRQQPASHQLTSQPTSQPWSVEGAWKLYESLAHSDNDRFNLSDSRIRTTAEAKLYETVDGIAISLRKNAFVKEAMKYSQDEKEVKKQLDLLE